MSFPRPAPRETATYKSLKTGFFQQTCDKQITIFEASHLFYVKWYVNIFKKKKKKEKKRVPVVCLWWEHGVGRRLQRGSGVTGAQKNSSGFSQPQITPWCQMERFFLSPPARRAPGSSKPTGSKVLQVRSLCWWPATAADTAWHVINSSY